MTAKPDPRVAAEEARADARAARQDRKQEKGLNLRKARSSRKTQATKRDRSQGR